MYSRRDIGRLALASLPLARAFGKLDSHVNGVLIGAQSYSFRDRPLDAAIQGFVDVGLSECELSMGHVEPEFPRGPDGRAALRKWRLTVPLDEIRAGPAQVRPGGHRAFRLRLQHARRLHRRGDRARRIRGGPGAGRQGDDHLGHGIGDVPRIAAQAGKYKIVVGMHGHSNIKDPNEFAKPETFVEAMKVSPYIAVNLDIGHYWAAGFDPVPFIEEHHERIVTLHIKDRKKNQGKNMPLGEGDTPIKEVLQLLKRKKYPIPANIEYEYDGGDTVAEVRKCYDYCRAALA
jgi:sugar phosphate isomerase/epimerase